MIHYKIYYKLDVLEKKQDLEVCKKGDADNDGVCDDGIES
jgi:OOP family OmpA-OmpF porin